MVLSKIKAKCRRNYIKYREAKENEAMDFEESFFENESSGSNDSSDEDFEFDKENSIDYELLSELVEFILDGNCTRRWISVLVFAILRF
jgi:hypothetical protein